MLSGANSSRNPNPNPGTESSTQPELLGDSEGELGTIGSFDPFVQCVSMKGLSQPIKFCARPLIQEIIGEWDDEVKQQSQQTVSEKNDGLTKETNDRDEVDSILRQSSSSVVDNNPIVNSNTISTDHINANTTADDLRLKLKQMLAAAATPSRLVGNGTNSSSSMMTMNSAVADAAQVPPNQIIFYLIFPYLILQLPLIHSSHSSCIIIGILAGSH